jgi:hypothetical protein
LFRARWPDEFGEIIAQNGAQSHFRTKLKRNFYRIKK